MPEKVSSVFQRTDSSWLQNSLRRMPSDDAGSSVTPDSVDDVSLEKLRKSEEVQTADQVENLDNVGVPEERIKRMGEDDNFWMNGVTGPCGPCSEIYYDFHPDKGYVNADFGNGSRFIELYNLVFMQYNKKDDGSLEPLKQKNIDTGMGLECMAQVLQKVPNNYETDLIFPIIEKASNLAMISYSNADDVTKANLKIIGDHMRAVGYLISDGVVPSNVGRGYVVRRLIRRVVRTGKMLGIKGDVEGSIEGAFLPILARTVIELSTNIDPDVKTRIPRILEELNWKERKIHPALKGLSPLPTNHDKTACSPVFEDVSFNEVDASPPEENDTGVSSRPAPNEKEEPPDPKLERGAIFS